MKNAVTTAILIMLMGLASPADAATDQQWATIGTGALTGVYHSAGHAIRKTVARHRGKERVPVLVKATRGSSENLEAVTSGRFYFGIVQSDLQYKAYHGVLRSPWGGKTPDQSAGRGQPLYRGRHPGGRANQQHYGSG